MAEEKSEYRQAQIKWPFDPGKAEFTNSIVVQADKSGRLYIGFFQANPPVILGEDAITESKKGIDINANPVARVVMGKEDAATLVKLLQKYLGQQQ